MLITGANSGIGKAVALLFAKHGVDISFIYYKDGGDAEKTKAEISALGRNVIAFQGDINDLDFCKKCVAETIAKFGMIDILINNAGTQIPADNIIDLQEENIRKTFNSNIVGMILLTKEVFPYLKRDSCIINTTSAVAYSCHEELLDYSATKDAIVSSTRSLLYRQIERNPCECSCARSRCHPTYGGYFW